MTDYIELRKRGQALADVLARIIDQDNEDGYFVEPMLCDEPEMIEARRALTAWLELLR